MKFSPLLLCSLSLAYCAEQHENAHDSMMGIEGSLINARQVSDTLNQRLKADGGAHSNEERLVAFITGADSQIDNAIATISDALAPMTMGLSKAVGNYLLGPFVQSVTNGAEVFLANVLGNGEDRANAQLVGLLTGDYSRLIQLSKQNNVDVAHLEDLNNQIMKTVPKLNQRATDSDIAGVHGSIVNAGQVQDTLTRRLNQAGGDPHANADRLVAFITGADSQIDNAIATISDALSPMTMGLSKVVGNFLLGPYVQSVTNGAEVLLANLIGGGADYADAELVGRLTGNYSKLSKLASKNDVNSSRLLKLSEQISNTIPH